MPKVNVTKSLVMRGKIYNPGPQDVGEQEAADLAKRGAIEGNAPAPAAEASQTLGIEGGDSPLEPIAARISESLGIERTEGETPVAFLERFAAQCGEVAENLGAQTSALQADADKSRHEVEAAYEEIQRLRGEVETLQAQLTEAQETAAQLAAEAPAAKSKGR